MSETTQKTKGTVTTCNGHALMLTLITKLRDKNMPCGYPVLQLVEQIATLVCYEAMGTLPLITAPVTTRTKETTDGFSFEEKIVLMPIFRAGISMGNAAQALIPFASVHHVGIRRDEATAQPMFYYENVPPTAPDHTFVLDPMLATGGSASDVITRAKKWGSKKVTFVGIIAAPEGVARLQKDHPDVDIVVAVIDRCLNAAAYILPGIGDAGDMQYNSTPEKEGGDE